MSRSVRDPDYRRPLPATVQIRTDDEAIDRAAAALAKPEWWTILPEWVKDQYREQARAVITALTGPIP
ncbi:hypothetical protein [Arthrobacter sp. C152]